MSGIATRGCVLLLALASSAVPSWGKGQERPPTAQDRAWSEAIARGDQGGTGLHWKYLERKQLFRVVQARRGTPAAHAGLRAGDVIVAVDGKQVDPTAGFTLRGTVGSEVRLTVQRRGRHLSFVVVRAPLDPP